MKTYYTTYNLANSKSNGSYLIKAKTKKECKLTMKDVEPECRGVKAFEVNLDTDVINGDYVDDIIGYDMLKDFIESNETDRFLEEGH